MRPTDYTNYGLAKELQRQPNFNPNIVAEVIRRLLEVPYGAALYQDHKAAPADPLDTPLPCDLTAGGVTIGKGCPLRTVQLRLQVQADANALLLRRVKEALAAKAAPAAQGDAQPRLSVRITSFPESNGKRNWTAMLVRVEPWDGLIGNAGGITIDRGEFWNRVAYEAERARFLIGERDTEPFILDYGDDIQTPDEWKGEVSRAARSQAKKGGA